jgi:tetratricopeptide (TPR) repeat protein
MLLWMSPLALADEPSVGGVFLSEGMGPRPAAMGEAFTAVGEDVNGMYWNPGGLVRSSGINILFSHTIFLQGFNDEYLALSIPLTQQDALGMNAYFSYINQLEKTTLDSPDVSTYDASDMYLGAAWSHAFSKRYSAGITLKGVRQAIDTYAGMTGACDVSVLAKDWLPNFNAGMTMRNLGQPLKLKEEGYALPASLDAGIAYRFWNRDFLHTLDVSVPWQQPVVLKMGLEYNFEDLVFIRAGYRYFISGNDLGWLAGLTAGVGITISDYNLEYAYSPYGILGDVHRIAITIPFGRSSVDEEKVIQRLERNLRVRQEKIIQEHIKTADQYAARKDYANAKVYYEKVAALNPQYPGLKGKMAQNETRMAQSQADKQFQRGMKAYQQEEYMAALIEWNKVAESCPDYKDIKKWLGAANQKLLQTSKNTGAAAMAGTANSQAEAYITSGLEYLQNRQYRKALEIWQEALRRGQGNAQIRNLIQKAKNKIQQEIAEWLQDAREALQNEEWVNAVKLWRQVLKLEPDNAVALQQLDFNQMKIRSVANDLYVTGVNNYVQNKLSEAVQNWKDLLVLDPDNQKAKKHLESVKRKIEDIQTIQQ